MAKDPKGKKGWKRRLQAYKNISAREVKKAMLEASGALDRQAQELIALKRILVSERAQVIYYTDKYQACIKQECFDLQPFGFLELPEELQTVYIKRAVQELSDNQGLVPHDPEAAAAQKTMQQTGRRIVLPGESGVN